MKAENAIEVKNVTKMFKVYLDKGHTIKEKVLFRNRRRYEERKVLDGISFEVKKGEAVGLIGQNGCGKSTTLKLLTRIMYPDSGSIEMRGRVSSLIELGAGFHPDMSGRQNIYTNASIFGLTRKEIDRRLPDIIAFSELEKFIDNPVRTYSSGMYMRLAFAVAINVDADILLIDEILAVGDASFQAKCFDRLKEIKANGATIVIVSHSMGQIEQICDRSIWINEGKIVGEGIPRIIDNEYLNYVMNKEGVLGNMEVKANEEENVKERKPQEEEDIKSENHEEVREEKPRRIGNGFLEFTDVHIEKEGKKIDNNKFSVGESITIVMEYKRNNPQIKNSVFGIHIFRTDGLDCYGSNTFIDDGGKIEIQDRGIVKCHIDKIQLLQGEYTVDVAGHNEYGQTYQHVYEAIKFKVYNVKDEVGMVRISHHWEASK